ncbi:MAG: prolyl oligopeptidase family serine peptidase [Lentisphaeraceae bacterium]|nr:prolyl oligopeptidase family serine peptidase [Lentisphaeraceae bacterium]
MIKSSTKLFILLTFIHTLLVAQESVGPWNLKELYKAPNWEKTDLAPKAGVTGILYDSINYKGKRVQTFAYYSAPKGTAPEGGWPAVICVHGGGGTAFDAWVKIWNSHGYAAISMDLEGHLPLKKNKGEVKSGRLSTPNPGPARDGVFHDFEKPVTNQWYYHAVTQIILAHSLVRSFPEVNPDKTGIIGVSWGGNLTSTTMGVDNRYKFAIPAYGCGFLIGSSGHQGRVIKKGKHWDTVAKYYDGSAYFKNVKIPTLWVNGTNDYHFALPATQKSSQAVNSPATLRYQVKMKHGHGPVWFTKECYAFADSVIKNKKTFLKVSKPKLNNSSLSVSTTGTAHKATLVYTLDKNPVWPDKTWQESPAKINGKNITSTVSSDAVAAFFNITDENGMMISSEFVELK